VRTRPPPSRSPATWPQYRSQPHVPLRRSIVRLGGSCARASASAPAALIRFSADREHHILQYDPPHHTCALAPNPRRSAATRLQARHTAPHATRSAAHAQTDSARNTGPSRTYRRDRAPSDSAAVCPPAPPRPQLRFGCLQTASTTTLRYDPPHHTCALAPIRGDPPPPACKLGILLHTRPAAQPMLRPTAAAIQAPAARTAEIELRQTRWQCARQRLHARISDSVLCRPRAPPTLQYDPPHHTCALAPIRGDPPPPGCKLGTPAPHATRNPAHARTNSGRNTSPSRTYR
jgi:hypothetical protein